MWTAAAAAASSVAELLSALQSSSSGEPGSCELPLRHDYAGPGLVAKRPPAQQAWTGHSACLSVLQPEAARSALYIGQMVLD